LIDTSLLQSRQYVGARPGAAQVVHRRQSGSEPETAELIEQQR
jgi:hypothetical protein